MKKLIYAIVITAFVTVATQSATAAIEMGAMNIEGRLDRPDRAEGGARDGRSNDGKGSKHGGKSKSDKGKSGKGKSGKGKSRGSKSAGPVAPTSAPAPARIPGSEDAGTPALPPSGFQSAPTNYDDGHHDQVTENSDGTVTIDKYDPDGDRIGSETVNKEAYKEINPPK